MEDEWRMNGSVNPKKTELVAICCYLNINSTGKSIKRANKTLEFEALRFSGQSNWIHTHEEQQENREVDIQQALSRYT